MSRPKKHAAAALSANQSTLTTVFKKAAAISYSNRINEQRIPVPVLKAAAPGVHDVAGIQSHSDVLTHIPYALRVDGTPDDIIRTVVDPTSREFDVDEWLKERYWDPDMLLTNDERRLRGPYYYMDKKYSEALAREKYFLKYHPWALPERIVTRQIGGIGGYTEDAVIRPWRWSGHPATMYKFLTSSGNDRNLELHEMESRLRAIVEGKDNPRNGEYGIEPRPKEDFYRANVKATEGIFHSSLGQLNQLGACDAYLLTIVPRPGVKDSMLAASWLEVPRELSLIYDVLRSAPGVVRFILTVEVHPGAKKSRSKVKPAAGELGSEQKAPASRNNDDGALQSVGGKGKKPRASRYTPKERGASGVSANLKKPATWSNAKKKKAARKKARVDENEREEWNVREDDDEDESQPSEKPSSPSKEQQLLLEEELKELRKLKERVAVLNPTLLAQPLKAAPPPRIYKPSPKPPPLIPIPREPDLSLIAPVWAKKPAAKPTMSPLSQIDGAGDLPPSFGRIMYRTKQTARQKRIIESDDDDGDEEADEQSVGEKQDSEQDRRDADQADDDMEELHQPGNEYDMEDEFIAGNDEIVEEEPIMIDGEPPVIDPAAIDNMLQALKDQQSLVTQIGRVGGNQVLLQKHMDELTRLKVEAQKMGIEFDDGDEEEADEAEGTPEQEGYERRRAVAKAAENSQNSLLKYHPHYHASVTFTRASGTDELDLLYVKRELIARGMRDVNVKRTYSTSETHWSRVERYTCVALNDPLTWKLLKAVNHGHTQVSIDGETSVEHKMRLGVEYTNPVIMRNIDGWYKRLELYYWLLRTRTVNSKGEPEIPSLSPYYERCGYTDTSSFSALQQPFDNAAVYMLSIRNYCIEKRLRFFLAPKAKTWQVYAPVVFKDSMGVTRTVNSSHELMCPDIDSFIGHLISASLSWFNDSVKHSKKVSKAEDFKKFVTGALSRSGERAKTFLPILEFDYHVMAMGTDGWFLLCDDPHNPNTPNAKERIRYIKSANGHQPKCPCIDCNAYVNLPVWFPLAGMMKRNGWEDDDGSVRSYVSPFLYSAGTYKDHMDGFKTKRVVDLVNVKLLELDEVARTPGKSCYFVDRMNGNIEKWDQPLTIQGDASWRGPTTFLKVLEPYGSYPCENHLWVKEKRDDDRDGMYICKAMNTATKSECGTRLKGRLKMNNWVDPITNTKQSKRSWSPPEETSRPSWGPDRKVFFHDMRRTAYQEFIFGQLALVIYGTGRLGKTLVIQDIGPDGKMFHPSDIMFIGTGQADKFGAMKRNVRLLWGNEWTEKTLKAVDLKPYLEASSMPARGMGQASEWQCPRHPKFLIVNPEVKRKKLYMEVENPDTHEMEKHPIIDQVTGKQKVEQKEIRPFGWNYDSGNDSVIQRMAMFRFGIKPQRLEESYTAKVIEEGPEILVYHMTLRYVPLDKRVSWRLGSCISHKVRPTWENPDGLLLHEGKDGDDVVSDVDVDEEEGQKEQQQQQEEEYEPILPVDEFMNTSYRPPPRPTEINEEDNIDFEEELRKQSLEEFRAAKK